jgi:hypothetical protein
VRTTAAAWIPVIVVTASSCSLILGTGDYAVGVTADASLDGGGEGSVDADAASLDAPDSLADASDSASSDDGLAADEAATAIANAICLKAQACFGTTGFVDLPTCEARYHMRYVDVLNASGMGWTPALLEACSNQVTSDSCKEYWDGNPCFDQAGTEANGTACGTYWQCASSDCQFTPNSLCGICGTPKDAGASCQNSSECGFYDFCAASACATWVQPGGTCAQNTSYCDWGSVCRNGMCVASSPGAACTPLLQDCPQYYFCSSTTNTCQPFSFGPPGSTCGFLNMDDSVWQDCSVGSCNPSAQQWTGTCPLVAQDGQPCDDMTTYCIFPSFCLGGVCKADHPQDCK